LQIGFEMMATFRDWLNSMCFSIVVLNAQDSSVGWQFSTGLENLKTGLSAGNGWLFAEDTEGNLYAYKLMVEVE
jgi:hypothetical protein